MSQLIHVECLNHTIKCTVIDEDDVGSMMCLAYWKGLGSPKLSKYTNMLIDFNGRLFRPHGIIPSLEVQLGGRLL